MNLHLFKKNPKSVSFRETETHIYFWGSLFSNWANTPFKYKNISFENSEQAYMWEKCMFFGQEGMAEDVLFSKEPRECKSIGRSIPNFDEAKWSEISFQVMRDVNLEKYRQHKDSLKFLKESGDKIIVEASPFDKIWGIGLHYDEEDVLDESKWKGQNLLGKVLMEVRETLKNV